MDAVYTCKYLYCHFSGGDRWPTDTSAAAYLGGNSWIGWVEIQPCPIPTFPYGGDLPGPHRRAVCRMDGFVSYVLLSFFPLFVSPACLQEKLTDFLPKLLDCSTEIKGFNDPPKLATFSTHELCERFARIMLSLSRTPADGRWTMHLLTHIV